MFCKHTYFSQKTKLVEKKFKPDAKSLIFYSNNMIFRVYYTHKKESKQKIIL